MGQMLSNSTDAQQSYEFGNNTASRKAQKCLYFSTSFNNNVTVISEHLFELLNILVKYLPCEIKSLPLLGTTGSISQELSHNNSWRR